MNDFRKIKKKRGGMKQSLVSKCSLGGFRLCCTDEDNLYHGFTTMFNILNSAHFMDPKISTLRFLQIKEEMCLGVPLGSITEDT